ncbi:MAG TPA: hypothetical protein VEH62_09725 [Gemmatimonadales bacterium]|nr:hypothetical protein [Gemmatimonadales bacterium]
MTMEQGDDALPERLHEAARGYHAPRPTPREAIWAGIAAERERRRTVRHNLRRVRWGLALAAMLVLGIGIGRFGWLIGGPRAAPNAVAAARPPAPTAYRVAAAQYLARTEVLLTGFRAESRRTQLDPQFVSSARDLLTTTRLMLDSPAGDDASLKTLLQDLELVLAQITQLPDEPGRQGDIDLINEGMTQRSVLTRLRAATPAVGVPAHTQGAL